jgi:5-oxoprolinase (ATP-hydrolysing) subunit A
MQIDLNADMGESFGMYTMGNDEAFMKYISAANVACGFHAGDSSVMKKTVGFAKQYGVHVGAHPGLPDLQGFGRREMNLTPDEVYCDVMYQMGALKAFVEAAGLRLHHVKPHGSLYGMVHRREEVAQAVCQAIKDLDPSLYLYIMKKGVVATVAQGMGVRKVFELYADLGYDSEGNLVITRHHGAHDPVQVADRVLRMVKDGQVKSEDGNEISIEGTSVCVHADTPGALSIVKAVRGILEDNGVEVAAPPL